MKLHKYVKLQTKFEKIFYPAQILPDTAKTISDGGNAESGGDLGWRKLEDVPSLFADYIPDMVKGDISELIQSPSGFHIIKISDIRSDEKNIIQQTHARHILIKPDDLINSAQSTR